MGENRETAVAIGGPGDIAMAVQKDGYVYIGNQGIEYWRRKAAPLARYTSCAMSDDATVLVAVTKPAPASLIGPQISKDGGNTFATFGNGSVSLKWNSVACDSNCTHIAMVGKNGGFGAVYVSLDQGTSGGFLATAPTQKEWVAVAMTASGTPPRVLAAQQDGSLYLFSTTTAAWDNVTELTAAGTPRPWTSVAMSSNGNVIAASAGMGVLKVSRDGGVAFADLMPYLALTYQAVALSGTGDTLFTSTADGRVFSASYASSVWTWTPALYNQVLMPISSLAVSNTATYALGGGNSAGGSVFFRSAFGYTSFEVASERDAEVPPTPTPYFSDDDSGATQLLGSGASRWLGMTMALLWAAYWMVGSI